MGIKSQLYAIQNVETKLVLGFPELTPNEQAEGVPIFCHVWSKSNPQRVSMLASLEYYARAERMNLPLVECGRKAS